MSATAVAGSIDEEFRAILWAREPVFFRPPSKFLLARLELPPTSQRIIGALAGVPHVVTTPVLFLEERIKTGTVKRVDAAEAKAVVEGLAQSVVGARKYEGLPLDPPFRQTLKAFGQRGNLIVTYEPGAVVHEGDTVTLRIRRGVPVNPHFQ
jgi:hypothetical protein